VVGEPPRGRGFTVLDREGHAILPIEGLKENLAGMAEVL